MRTKVAALIKSKKIKESLKNTCYRLITNGNSHVHPKNGRKLKILQILKLMPRFSILTPIFFLSFLS